MKRRLRRILLFFANSPSALIDRRDLADLADLADAKPFIPPRLPILLLIACLALGACSTVSSRIQQNPQAYNRLSAHDQSLVWHGQIREGMGKDPVYLAWGKPDAVKMASYMGTPHETWTYLAYYSYASYDFGPYGMNPWYFRGDVGYYPWYGINYPVWGYPYRAATFVNGKVVAWSTTYW